MATNSGKPYTPAEDALIRNLLKVPGATAQLAERLGRTRVAISMRRAELCGNVKKKSRSTYNKRPKPVERRSAVRLPVARPAWFEEENIAGMLTARRGI